MGNDAPIVSWDAGRGLWVYRASALGGCETAMVAARTGLTGVAPPEQFQKIFDAGHELEQPTIDLFLALGMGWEQVPETAYVRGQKDLLSFGSVIDGQVRLELRVGTGAVIRAHADAFMHHGPDVYRLYEGKAFGEDLFRAFTNGALIDGKGLWEKYRVQLSVMMHACGLPAIFAAGLKVDSDDGEKKVVQSVHYTYVDVPPIGLGALKARVARVETRASEASGGLTCWQTDYPCPFHFIHATNEDAQDVETVEDDQLLRLLELRDSYKLAQAQSTGELKTVNENIAKLLEVHGRKAKGAKTRVGDWMVTWMEVDQPARTVKGYTSRYALIKRVEL